VEVITHCQNLLGKAETGKDCGAAEPEMPVKFPTVTHGPIAEELVCNWKFLVS